MRQAVGSYFSQVWIHIFDHPSHSLLGDPSTRKNDWKKFVSTNLRCLLVFLTLESYFEKLSSCVSCLCLWSCGIHLRVFVGWSLRWDCELNSRQGRQSRMDFKKHSWREYRNKASKARAATFSKHMASLTRYVEFCSTSPPGGNPGWRFTAGRIIQ